MEKGALPFISIIVPSFNKVDYIEETLQCLINQRYPHKEIIVMDGASTDGTIDILKKYDSEITWFSEKDRGQTHALNKGIKIASGDVIGWLNADDLYEKNTLDVIGNFFGENPKTMWAFGNVSIIDGKGREIRKPITAYKRFKLKHYSYASLLAENYISQMGVFMRKSALDEIGEADEALHYTMDYDLWLRLGKKYEPGYIPANLAYFRMYEETKSMTGFEKQFAEGLQVAKRHGTGQKWPLFLHHLNNLKITCIYKMMALFSR